MTETQIKFLMEYLGEKFHGFKKMLPNNNSVYKSADYMCLCGTRNCEKHNSTFTTVQDKQDLLDTIISKGDLHDFCCYVDKSTRDKFMFAKYLIQLSPEETAKLICKWKGW